MIDDFSTVKPAVAKAEGIGMFLMDRNCPVTERDQELIVNLPVE